MLSPTRSGIAFREVDTCRVVREPWGRPNLPLTREDRYFYTIHSPYYDYYSLNQIH
jgi:hypothetical protein